MIPVRVLALSGVVALSCGRAGVEGSVVDPWGRGLEGVTVQVAKSGVKAETDPKGTYSVAAQIPGDATLRFSKPAYTTEHLRLAISGSAVHLAAPRVVLTPIPPRGVAVIGDERLVGLIGAPVEKREDGNYYCHAGPAYSIVALKAGKLRFVDRVPAAMSVFPISREGRLGAEQGNPGGEPLITRDSRVGAEQLLIREVEAKNGAYAWVALVKSDLGGRRAELRSPCYPFVIFSPSARWRGKIPLTGDQ